MVYDIISRLNEIFFVLISVLIFFSFSFLMNIGKEMSLPGFRIKTKNAFIFLRYPVWQHTFVSPSAFSRRAVVSYWRKYVHEVLVNA